MRTTTHQNCCGTVAKGGSGEQEHQYCDRCGAYTYDMDAEDLPSGTDERLNQAAYSNGDEQSPDARDDE